jgi:hypothetical protein
VFREVARLLGDDVDVQHVSAHVSVSLEFNGRAKTNRPPMRRLT